jgi:ferritin-like metal-binding protein YciE
MPVATLNELFLDALRELHEAECRCARVQRDLAHAARSPELAGAFRDQVYVAIRHAARLSDLSSRLRGASGSGWRLSGQRWTPDDSSPSVGRRPHPGLGDAELLALAEPLHHGLIARYGCARMWAQLVGSPDASLVLGEMLDDERDADSRLTQIADRLEASVHALGPWPESRWRNVFSSSPVGWMTG